MVQMGFVMGLPPYLLKKHDTYYFRQAWPKSVQPQIGKKEVIRSLAVKEKSLAVRMAREFKVQLDDVVDQLLNQPLTGFQVAENFLSNSLSRIKIKHKPNSAGSGKLSEDIQTVPPIISPIPVPLQPVSAHSENNLQNNSQSPRVIKSKIDPLFEKYCSEKMRLNQWSSKTLRERTSHFRLTVDLLRYHKKVKEVYVEDITIEYVREIKEMLLLLPKNHNKKFVKSSIKDIIDRCKMVETNNYDGMSLSEISKIRDKISLNTITDKYFSTVKGFWY